MEIEAGNSSGGSVEGTQVPGHYERLAQLYDDGYFTPMVNIVGSRYGVDSGDLMQATLVRGLRNARLTEGDNSQYVYTTVKRLAIDHFRHEQTVPEGHISPKASQALNEPESGEAPTFVPVISDTAEHTADKLLVEELISGLSGDQREAVVLRYYGDLTDDQIAERLGIPVGTVKGRLYWARHNMRQAMKKQGIGSRRDF